MIFIPIPTTLPGVLIGDYDVGKVRVSSSCLSSPISLRNHFIFIHHLPLSEIVDKPDKRFRYERAIGACLERFSSFPTQLHLANDQ
jgi:hypothetical protein